MLRQVVPSRVALVLVVPAMLLSACSESDESASGDGDGDSAGDGDGDGDASGGAGAGGAGGAGGMSPSGGGGTLASGSGGDGSGGTAGSGGGPSDMKKTYVYVGSGDWGDAEPGMITVFEMDRASRVLSFVSSIDAGGLASFLAIDVENERLFSGDEKNGGVLSFSINPETGELTSQGMPVGSSQPVYLELTPEGDYLFAANYNQGSVQVYPIDSGVALAPVQTELTGSETHCITMDSQGRVLVANKGSDTLSSFTYAAGLLTPRTPATTALVSPRHIVYDSLDRPYVVSETAEWLTRYDVQPGGQLLVNFSESRLPMNANPAVDTGADVVVTQDDSFVYVSNRGGENSVAAFDLRSGTAVLIGHVDSGGTTPRKISLDPQGEFLVVGNRESQNITVFDIQANGSLTVANTQDITPSPFFVQVVEF